MRRGAGGGTGGRRHGRAAWGGQRVYTVSGVRMAPVKVAGTACTASPARHVRVQQRVTRMRDFRDARGTAVFSGQRSSGHGTTRTRRVLCDAGGGCGGGCGVRRAAASGSWSTRAAGSGLCAVCVYAKRAASADRRAAGSEWREARSGSLNRAANGKRRPAILQPAGSRKRAVEMSERRAANGERREAGGGSCARVRRTANSERDTGRMVLAVRASGGDAGRGCVRWAPVPAQVASGERREAESEKRAARGREQ